MSRFLHAKYQKMTPYVPGEQPRDKAYVKLNTNESPYPPAPAVLEAIERTTVEDLRLYCDPECKKLKTKLSQTYGVNDKNVFVCNGSDEALNFAFMAFGEKGATYADITYGFYEVFADLHAVISDIIPLSDSFAIEVEKYYGKNNLVIIANPNAPTGKALSLGEIESVVKNNPDGVVVVDEAYVDFGADSAVNLTAKYDNLLVVHTFSKSRSMAGARLGYAIGNEALISDLELIKYSTNPYNVNSLTQLLGVKTLENAEYYSENCKKIAKTRDNLIAWLEDKGFTVLPSKANFIFAKTEKVSGEELYLRLKDEGVLVRYFKKERIKDFCRITIGSKEQTEILKQKIDLILSEK